MQFLRSTVTQISNLDGLAVEVRAQGDHDRQIGFVAGAQQLLHETLSLFLGVRQSEQFLALFF